MTITWIMLGRLLLSLAVTIYIDCLKQMTEEMDRLVWKACINSGGEATTNDSRDK